MIIFDTTRRGKPELSMFEGGTSELTAKQGTYKSFGKARKIVIAALKDQIKQLQSELSDVEALASPDDLVMVRCPFTGYLRSLHGER